MMYDKVIIGGGLYGLYSALFCGKRKENVLVLEYEDAPFKRATYINQARVHMGYHYPRSYSTAIKSANYFERFNEDYGFCIHKKFEKIYATSSSFSWSNAEQFQRFCEAANIKCMKVYPDNFFQKGLCDGAFKTNEYTYDANILRDYFLEKIGEYSNVMIIYNARIHSIYENGSYYEIAVKDLEVVKTKFILNATYAAVNQLLEKINFEKFQIKYELCEIILCRVNDKLKNTGITVMDGPFFSIMPFGKSGLHSLTSVTFTPHLTSYDSLPIFDCQKRVNVSYCSPKQLGNCNECEAKPTSAWDYMSKLARKYLNNEYQFEYVSSLYSMKPILKASEIDDSRPTLIRKFNDSPTFVSVLSGKINTVYDLDEVLENGK